MVSRKGYQDVLFIDSVEACCMYCRPSRKTFYVKFLLETRIADAGRCSKRHLNFALQSYGQFRSPSGGDGGGKRPWKSRPSFRRFHQHPGRRRRGRRHAVRVIDTSPQKRCRVEHEIPSRSATDRLEGPCRSGCRGRGGRCKVWQPSTDLRLRRTAPEAESQRPRSGWAARLR